MKSWNLNLSQQNFRPLSTFFALEFSRLFFSPPFMFMLWELDFSIFHTSLQIKSQKLVVFVVQLSRIFHYYNIDWREHRGFDSKDTINFSQQTHILLQIKVIYQVIKHVEQYLFFLTI